MRDLREREGEYDIQHNEEVDRRSKAPFSHTAGRGFGLPAPASKKFVLAHPPLSVREYI
jgi:hypothetical protein